MTADGLPETAAPGDPGPATRASWCRPLRQPPGYGVNRPRGRRQLALHLDVGRPGPAAAGRAETAAGAGDLVVLAPGVPHGYGVEPGARHWRFWWAHCRARPSWAAWLRPYGTGDGMYVGHPRPGPAARRPHRGGVPPDARRRPLDRHRAPAAPPRPPGRRPGAGRRGARHRRPRTRPVRAGGGRPAHRRRRARDPRPGPASTPGCAAPRS